MARNKSSRMTSASAISPSYRYTPMLRTPGPLLTVQDFRTYDPTPDYDTPRTKSGRVAKVRLKDRQHQDRFGNFIRAQSQTKAVLAFADPKRAITCLRRKIRREVMFAGGYGGMAPRRMRPRRLNHQSKVKC